MVKNVFFKVRLTAALAVASAGMFAQNVWWANNFGGNDDDRYNAVAAVADGIVAVGYSEAASFNSGDWADSTGKGNADAIIVKYDNNGNVLWKKQFGGNGSDYYHSVTVVSDGIVAVGLSTVSSFGTGDWTGITAKGGWDAIIVKYDNNGNVLWKKHFGGNSDDVYYSVTAVPDGIVAVGYSQASSFNNGDWTDSIGKGSDDAIMVKYDNNGNVLWKKHFGGSGGDRYGSVTAVADGIVAVGYSYQTSFGNGDWQDSIGKGGDDAIMVKYDPDGNVLWKKHFGGSAADYYQSVIAVSDGIAAVGYSASGSFGNGDWQDSIGKGSDDAIMVKYDPDGNMLWKKHFGGSGDDRYYSVTAVTDGIVAVGYSEAASFGSGDWTGITGKGSDDAIIVKYDPDGNVVWKKHFGGSDEDYYRYVTAIPDGIATVGFSYMNSFGTGDWAGITGKGNYDATIVKYLISVTDITDVPATITVGTPLTLTGTVEPSDASFQTIVWRIKDVGTTGATLSGNVLNTTVAGTATVTATITNGTAMGEDYTQDFTITSVVIVSVIDIMNIPNNATAGVPLELKGTVVPSSATNKNIVWSVADAGTANGYVYNDTLFYAVQEGTSIVRATIKDGKSIGEDYTQDVYITVGTVGIGDVGAGCVPSVRIFPNPTGGKFTILDLRLDDLKSNDLEFEIYDVVGQVVQSKIVNLKSKIEIDISHLAAGLYFLKVDNKMIKVIKE